MKEITIADGQIITDERSSGVSVQTDTILFYSRNRRRDVDMRVAVLCMPRKRVTLHVNSRIYFGNFEDNDMLLKPQKYNMKNPNTNSITEMVLSDTPINDCFDN